MELIHQPIDFYGQNIYNGYPVRAGADGEPEFVDRPAGFPKTAAEWPVTPECLYWAGKFLYERYQLPIYITENGMSCHDNVEADGSVHDANRIQFLDEYLGNLQKAADEGVEIAGYFLWTFLDNFEWHEGYSERFGIIYVDYATQQRYVKDSAFWYKKVMESNGAVLSCNQPDRKIRIERGTVEVTGAGFKVEQEMDLLLSDGTDVIYVASGSGLIGSIWVDAGDRLTIPEGIRKMHCSGNMTLVQA